METKEAPLEFKAGKEPGTFSGYGAVFGNVDDGGDIIEPGAFKKIRAKKNGRIRMPLYHDMSRVVGDAEVIQDEKGLKVIGQLNMGLSYAADAYELMKDGTLDAMSVGFNILDKGAKWSEDYTQRTISKAELWEVSVVAFGMNRKAKIQTIKAVDLITARDIEDALRERFPTISRRKATAIASSGYRLLQGDPAGSGDESESRATGSVTLADMKSMIANYSQLF